VFIAGYTTNSAPGTPPSPWYVTSPQEITDDYWQKKIRKDIKLLPDSDFDHSLLKRKPVYVSGDVSGGFHLTNATADPTFKPTIPSYFLPRGLARSAENAAYVVQLCAKTHPFRSEFSIPTAIAELLDIGTLFKITAKGFSDLLGGTYLQYKFGIVQFVQDIQTLHSITKAIESRIKEFDSLSKHGALRRNVHLDGRGESGIYATNTSIWTSFGVNVRADKSYLNDYEVRGSVRWRWKPGVTVSLNKLEAFNLAVQKVFDLGELDAETIWNTIPWTWLADYFIAVGPYLQATSAENLLEPFDISIIRNVKCVNRYKVTSKTVGLSTSDTGVYTLYYKSRDSNLLVSALPPVRYSLISMSQYLVLLALYGKFRGSQY
jgi:hypothetical protein